MLSNYLREIEYMAQSASIGLDLESNMFSITFEISGFNDSLSKFTDQYLDKILSFVPRDQQDFENLKEKKKRDYQNFFKGNPYSQGLEYHSCSLKEGVGSEPEQKLAEIHNVTFEDIVKFGTEWKESIFSEIYIGGNFDKASAEQIGKSI